jgi:hypothetical protein
MRQWVVKNRFGIPVQLPAAREHIAPLFFDAPRDLVLVVRGIQTIP